MPDDYSDIHDAIGIVPTEGVGPLPAGKFFGELTGVNDLVRAVQSGRPENMLYAAGMLGLGAVAPEARGAKAAMTMSKLFSDQAWLGKTTMGAMHPQEYINKFGGVKQFAENFPESFKKMEPYLEKNADLSDEAIEKALEKNPGASLEDISGVKKSAWEPKSDWQQKADAAVAYNKANALRPSDFPSSVPFGVPPKAQELGFTTPAVHGTPDRWGWEGPKDQLKLPDEQLGVHFGQPSQAAHFSLGGINAPEYLGSTATYKASEPRTYPAVLHINAPLELRDMGSWGHEEMITALSEINRGEHMGYVGGRRVLSSAAEGQFPMHELDKLNDIKDVRDYLESKGYDSIKYTNSVEDPGKTSYIMFGESPVNKGYVSGVRSPFAAFDPGKTHWASLAASGGGILAYPLAKGDNQ